MNAPVTVTVTIMKNGTVTVGPIDPEDFERVGPNIMSIMRKVGGSPVVVTECLSVDEKEAMAQRLARVLLLGLVK